MKRADAFMLGMMVFVLANCISYFARSGAPYVTGWGMHPGEHGWFERVGFPFIVYDLSIGGVAPDFHGSWIKGAANLVIAVVVSLLSARFLVNYLPPLWPGLPRTLRYSSRGLLSVITIVGVLLGIAITSQSWALAVRNIVCLAGPVCAYGWFLYRRQVSWIHLTLVAVGLTLLTFAIDLRYHEPPIDRHVLVNAMLPIAEPKWSSRSEDWDDYSQRSATRRFVGLTAIRVMVPVFGLLSLLVIASVTYPVVRQYYHIWMGRKPDCH